MLSAFFALTALVACSGAVSHDAVPHGKLAKRQSSSFKDFGAGNSFCTCPPVPALGSLVEANAYLPTARNYFLDCQYGPNGSPCTYDTSGAAVNPPSTCPANSEPATTSGTVYCYVTCPATVGGAALDVTQSNVVIVASGTSYTTCRYTNGSNCQYNPLTGALGNTAAGGSCPSSTSKTSGCCFTLGTSAPAPAPVSSSSTISSSSISSTTTTSSSSSIVSSTSSTSSAPAPAPPSSSTTISSTTSSIRTSSSASRSSVASVTSSVTSANSGAGHLAVAIAGIVGMAGLVGAQLVL